MKNRLAVSFVALVALVTIASACTGEPDPGGAGPDLQPPTILSVDVIPPAGNAPGHVAPGQSMRISTQVTDNVGVTTVSFLVGRNGAPAGFCSGEAHLTGGTPKNGTWELNCVVPANVNSGTYDVGTLAVDGRLNATATSPTSPPEVAISFTVDGDFSDSDAPVIDSVVSSPLVVNRGGAVTISAHATDASGVSAVSFVLRFNKFANAQWCAGAATLVDGTANDGTWELTCNVPAGAAIGSYTVNTVATDVVPMPNIAMIDDTGAPAVTGPFQVVAAPAQ